MAPPTGNHVLATCALALVLLADLVPGDGVRLAPDPAPAVLPVPAPTAPTAPGPGPVWPVATGGALAGAAALAGTYRRRRGGADPPAEPLVVFVSGHGSGSAPTLFADLAAMMGLGAGDARYFDYRWADGGADHGGASQGATVDETADALGGYLAGLSDLGRPIYLVGHSKGGAGIAELVARWDRGEPTPGGVVGAALLDPPLASGIHGWLQSLGTLWGPLPDDGGYEPIVCSWRGCTDTRRHLGEASGVEVIVLRNPQAGITNFADVPEGLRVYEASDGGPGFFETLFTRPWKLPSRVTDAHFAVLHDPRVADCITAEMGQGGACSLPRPGEGPPAALIGHGPGTALKVSLNKML